MTERNEMAKPNATLVELWIGNVFFALLILVSITWFIENKITFILGLLLGCIMSAYLAYHMARSIEKALDLQAGVERIIRVSALLRYGLVIVVLIASYYVPYTNPIATFIGLMGLKVAAYLQPLTHKIISSFYKTKEEVQK